MISTRSQRAAALVCFVTVVAGCGSAQSDYAPRFVTRGELTLRYDDGVEIYAGKELLADSPGYGGLSDYVRCVAKAQEHADAAESDGDAAIGLGVTGALVGISGLGGLSGLAFLDTDKPLAFGLLGTGVAAGVIGMTLALFSRTFKNSANGHAVDAVNYYNDDVGFYGGTCARPVAPPVAAPPVAAPPVAVPPGPPAPNTDDVLRQNPDAVSPDAVSPDAVSPDAVSPDAVSPDAVSPDAVSPDAASPDAASPDAASPKADAPEGGPLVPADPETLPPTAPR